MPSAPVIKRNARQKAAQQGKMLYRGAPCKTCRGDRRYVTSASCYDCERSRAAINNAARRAQVAETAPKRGERYIGEPCKYGHNGIRYRSNGVCVECANQRNLAHMTALKSEGLSGGRRSKPLKHVDYEDLLG